VVYLVLKNDSGYSGKLAFKLFKPQSVLVAYEAFALHDYLAVSTKAKMHSFQGKTTFHRVRLFPHAKILAIGQIFKFTWLLGIIGPIYEKIPRNPDLRSRQSQSV
jgi:hypothetical protein